MSFFSRIFGGPTVDVISAIGSVFDKVFTSKEEKAQAQLLLEKLKQQPYLLQAEINRVEASHRSIFVAGWRPFIGWVCGVGFLWAFLGHPIFVWAVAIFQMDLTAPVLETDNLLELVLAMLGLGGLRTVEKLRGRSK